jgi:AcrR family transcriptional regulator
MPPRPAAPVRLARSQQKEQTAARILAAARELFAEQGFEETTTRRIAQRAGVAAGTLFAHFPDKNVLLAQCLRENIASVLDGTYASLPAQGIEAQLLHLSEGLIRFYAANARLSRELIKHATFQFGEPANAFNRQMAQFVALCAGLLRQAITRGELAPGLDVDGVARCYLAFHFFAVNGCLRDPDARPDAWLVQLRQMVATLLAGCSRH